MPRLSRKDVAVREAMVYEAFQATPTPDIASVQTTLATSTPGGRMNSARIYEIRRAALAGEGLPPITRRPTIVEAPAELDGADEAAE